MLAWPIMVYKVYIYIYIYIPIKKVYVVYHDCVSQAPC